MKFRHVLGMCESLVGGRIETIHIVGGGTRNRQLCQAAADACGRRVVAGPVEATAIGNLMVQAIAAGDAGSIAKPARSSARVSTWKSTSRGTRPAWDDAYGRFVSLLG